MLAVSDLQAKIGKIPVLKGVTLNVGAGETVALLGRNGVGKSSTLRAILGLLPRTGGRVSYSGNDLTKIAAHKVASLGIGYVPQGRGIFPLLSVEENLLLGLRKAPEPALLDEMYVRFPRLNERRVQAAGTLSGGEQQILAIARCMMMQPSLLILDEPTEGIAPKIVQQIRQEVANVAARGIAVLIVEQNVRTALKLASRIYLMERGAIVHEASPTALRADATALHRYLGVSL
ncbi:high-affinity branched-chain amino acid transport ATP-binding protein LivF [Variibacter gotjawalensis]|uniref:High-affinity branched-chain amino acid transport ATP-binding protein LivF n=1 Tax=Variibacter gotjawalensis TaxID=1333996 RepID=A0A0S3Q030_9BRAD|nr:ABC transporter ATP-binding protein [Variibacter gotjawalensis]NIK47377.1 branched-chain amino acid transport system ATP-binding protein [Variibacter gotjawalensis]RZS49273.1 amino acid/amide ABC transporter ATP-binding protein 2 (HAAT family) [Variibacter gotjawalensis]BAT61537.1 high-affinity branched-chain amino acid transport ATP-binding protein LivF [Variibacter gotjawalensis]